MKALFSKKLWLLDCSSISFTCRITGNSLAITRRQVLSPRVSTLIKFFLNACSAMRLVICANEKLKCMSTVLKVLLGGGMQGSMDF